MHATKELGEAVGGTGTILSPVASIIKFFQIMLPGN
jgi:hypothetical protein